MPNLRDLVKTDEQHRMVDFLEVSAQIGHGFFVSGDVPADRVKILRTAFDATMRDPAFLADAKKRRITVDPVGAAHMRKVVATAFAR